MAGPRTTRLCRGMRTPPWPSYRDRHRRERMSRITIDNVTEAIRKVRSMSLREKEALADEIHQILTTNPAAATSPSQGYSPRCFERRRIVSCSGPSSIRVDSNSSDSRRAYSGMHHWGAQLTEPLLLDHVCSARGVFELTHLLGSEACLCGDSRLVAWSSCPPL